MLTDRGWTATGAAVALGILWYLLGEIELLGAAVVLGVAVLAAVGITRTLRPSFSLTRRLSPTLVHEGDYATVSCVITNRRRIPLSDVTLHDQVGELGTAEFEAGSIGGDSSLQARYQILCRPRGVYEVGPARIRVSDPAGLAVFETRTGSIDRLIVYPEVEDLSGFPLTRGRDPAMQASRPEFSQRGGEDFFTLREYVQGDDLRYVHWPSSAKRDELMIRQLETPWQSRALIMFDVRDHAYESDACFEKAVRGAASVVRHLGRSGFDADLWAGGTTPINVSRYATAMEQLALVQPVSRIDIRAVAAKLRQSGRGGALILVTGLPDRDLEEVHRLMSRDYRSVMLLSATETSSPAEIAFQRAGALTLTISPTESWAKAWRRTTERTWLGLSAG